MLPVIPRLTLADELNARLKFVRIYGITGNDLGHQHASAPEQGTTTLERRQWQIPRNVLGLCQVSGLAAA